MSEAVASVFPSDGLPRIVTDTVPGPQSLALAARLRRVESPDITFLGPDFPVFWTDGLGCLVADADGNTFLDATSSFGVLGLGHRHPCVLAALAEQSAHLIHGMGDVHPSAVKVLLLEKIAALSPIPDTQIILGQNGSDAIEAALKTAYLATGKPGVLAFQGGYHGLSYGALEPTARPFFRDPFGAQRGGFAAHLPFGCPPDLIARALSESAIPIGAILAEPIQGRGGIRVPEDGWLTALRRICDAHGILLILDEILTGWGRTGTWFACNAENVVPDLLCVGKAMGGGMPISACLGSSELMRRAWGDSGGEARHTYTFLGHPLTCAVSLAALTALEDEDLVARSALLGGEMLCDLHGIAARHPGVIKEARGCGLMLGLEFISPALVWPVVLAALRRGLILLPAGDRGEVLELIPPFVMTDAQMRWCLATLEEAIGTLPRLPMREEPEPSAQKDLAPPASGGGGGSWKNR